MWDKFGIREWEVGRLHYSAFCAMETAIWEAIDEAELQASKEG